MDVKIRTYTCADCGTEGEQGPRGARRLRCDGCRSKRMQAHHSGALVRQCPTCHSEVRRKHATYCSDACRPQVNRLTYQEKRALQALRPCEACGAEYKPCRKEQRFCSMACYNQHNPPTSKGMSSRKYTPEEAKERQRACWQVKNRRRRAQLRGTRSEPYTTAEIAERDRFRCGLCGKRVPMDVRVPSPLAATIDHILPISEGGDDTRANVQLAHFRCNNVKGARGSQQLALIG